MPGFVHRNDIVKRFGTPDVTEGSANEPRERQENGFQFNEKWVFKHPTRDPAGATERVLYWRRYDYVGSVIRRSKDGDWERDDSLPDTLHRAA